MNPYDPVQQQERQFILFLGGLLGIAAVIGLAGYGLSQASRQARNVEASPTHLLLVRSGPEQAAPGVTAAPQVDPGQIDQRLTAASAVTGGELEVSLAWDSLTDLDLQVLDPAGEMITADHRYSRSGGVQDVDANPTPTNAEGRRRAERGLSPGPENVEPIPEILIDFDKQFRLPDGFTLPGGRAEAPGRFTRTPVEHIYFAQAPKGTYTIYARCYHWREPSTAPLPFTIQVRSRGQVFHQTSGVLGPDSFVTHTLAPTLVCQFQVR